jgi:hypothetical protein
MKQLLPVKRRILKFPWIHLRDLFLEYFLPLSSLYELLSLDDEAISEEIHE